VLEFSDKQKKNEKKTLDTAGVVRDGQLSPSFGAIENESWQITSAKLISQKLSGRASPLCTGTAESRKTVTSMFTRRDDQ
jgi:hypothetical protein